MFLDTPLERLHLDTELVRSVQRNPELLRKLARSSFRTILSINHPDVGGDGSLVDEASDAMAEINATNDEELGDIVEEFFAVRDSEEEQLKREQQALTNAKNERIRRSEEIRALLACAVTNQLTFSEAFIELGRSQLSPKNLLQEPDEFMTELPHIPDFVIVNSDLEGHALQIGKLRGTYDLAPDSVQVKNGAVVIEGSDARKSDDAAVKRRLKLSPKGVWVAEDQAKIIGVLDREHIDAPDAKIKTTRQLSSVSALPSARLGGEQSKHIDWQDISSTPWLRYVNPASGPKSIENKYVIVGSPIKESELAILGLCRKIVPRLS